MNGTLAHCLYLGQRSLKHIVGCQCPGFILNPPGRPHPDKQDEIIRPDAIPHSIHDLLENFQ
jgi:hypothetical protein